MFLTRGGEARLASGASGAGQAERAGGTSGFWGRAVVEEITGSYIYI